MSARSQPASPGSGWDGRTSHRWGVILAGGDGTRLLPLTRKIAGDDRPKQFCVILGGETLLGQTRSRVKNIIHPRQTLLAVTRTHERFYSGQVAGTHSSCLLIQPHNQGTAPAILYSLMRLRQLDPAAVVGFFPSDHHFADDAAFIAHVDSAFAVAESRSGLVVLLGITPVGPEVEYGWIEPGPPLEGYPDGSVCQVSRFWEKPSLSLASALLERGCLWNSFVMVGRVDCFLSLIRRGLPKLWQSFESIRTTFHTPSEEAALLALYSGISASNFSHDVLSANPSGLAVLCGRNLGWSDLGETGRVLSVLGRKGIRTEWALDGFETPKVAS